MRIALIAWLFCLAVAAPAVAAPLSDADRAAVLTNLAATIEGRYVDPAKGARLARQIRASKARWAGRDDPSRFAAEMTAWLREASGDGHFELTYSQTPITDDSAGGAFSQAEMLRFYGPQLNHGIEKIERHPGNILLLDLRAFPPNDMAGDVYAAAMTVAAQGDALIIDLRNNGGGADTINLMMGYLTPPGSPLSGVYDRPSNTTTTQNAPSWVPGRRFGDAKPLFVLISKRTFSAAEALAYDLQALKRATIVGETSGGGANPFEYRRVHPHFALSLPEKRSVNPLTGTNWQGVGVKPDVPVPAADALAKALELARAATGQRAP
jgi:hypothetical protein